MFLLKTIRTVKLISLQLTKKKFEKISDTIKLFKESINFLIDKSIDNPIFRKISKKGNIYFNYSSFPKIRKSFYFEWKSKFPSLHTHYCHSSARVTKNLLKSWTSWCFKRNRRLNNPHYKKNSMKLEECLCYLKGNYIILVIEPNHKLFIPFKLNKHFNHLITDNHGEITLKLHENRKIEIFIPFISEVEEKETRSIIGIDINERSIDLLFLAGKKTEFQSVDISKLSTLHYTYSLKRRNIARKIKNESKYQPKTRRLLLKKYGIIERNKTKDFLHKISNKISQFVDNHDSIVVMEDLTNIQQSNSRSKNLKSGQRQKSKKLRRRLNRWNFKQFQDYLQYKNNATGHLVAFVNPRDTSTKCLKCNKITKTISSLFVCAHCGFVINRHFQATSNIIEKYLTTQNVASSDPAERHRMTMMVREFRKFNEAIIRDASQYDNVVGNYPILSV